jgi:hypothetical protein
MARQKLLVIGSVATDSDEKGVAVIALKHVAR